MKTSLFKITTLFFMLIFKPYLVYADPLIIDHTCTDISQIPTYWINEAKVNFKISYGHTSHGSQIVTGMTVLKNQHGTLYDFNGSSGALSLHDYEPSGDLGNPDRVTWAQRTRDLLNTPGNDRNLIMWSWCGQVSDATEADITIYLTLMNQLEVDFPDVTFIYMTGHLDGTGEGGNLNIRNNQIRTFCNANNKILFDFADIESYDPDGNYFLHLGANDECYYSGGNWADQWCTVHPGECASCSCAHSRCLNCQIKGKAFWWMMARLAGWNAGTSTISSIPTTSSISTTSTTSSISTTSTTSSISTTSTTSSISTTSTTSSIPTTSTTSSIPTTSTTVIILTTTTIKKTTTTTTIDQLNCFVTISPSEVILESVQSFQFNATTNCTIGKVDGSYYWELLSDANIGSSINAITGLYQAGANNTTSDAHETIEITDTAHSGITGTADITVKRNTPPPPTCTIIIDPQSASVASFNTLQFIATTQSEDVECASPAYEWSLESAIGSTIDNITGVYTAGFNVTEIEATDVISVVDRTNDNVTASSKIKIRAEEIQGTIFEVFPDTLYSSSWLPIPGLLLILGDNTLFNIFSEIMFLPNEGIMPLASFGFGNILFALVLVEPYSHEEDMDIIVRTSIEGKKYYAVGTDLIKITPLPLNLSND